MRIRLSATAYSCQQQHTALSNSIQLSAYRNEELISLLKQSSHVADDLFGRRANLLVGFQAGVHYMIGGVWSRRRQ